MAQLQEVTGTFLKFISTLNQTTSNIREHTHQSHTNELYSFTLQVIHFFLLSNSRLHIFVHCNSQNKSKHLRKNLHTQHDKLNSLFRFRWDL